MKKILVLGAGLVSRPLINYLLDKGHILTVADMNTRRIALVTGHHPGVTGIGIDINNEEKLDRLIADHELVVSLLPASMHLLVANFCIRNRKSLITTSYQSPAMLELKPLIEEAGITVINEMGLDPGIDHMTARRIIDKVHAHQGKVQTFYSLCGALPSLESANNPLKYKFTWSPKGVMNASIAPARFLDNGEEVDLSGELLFRNPFNIEFPGIGKMEVYPNRDSLPYITEYGIEEVTSMFRGTIRLPGFCESFDALGRLGLLETRPFTMEHMTWFNLIERKVGTLYPDYEKQIARYLNVKEDSVAIQSLKWLGYFSNQPLGRAVDSPFNVTGDLMVSKMMLAPDERDMIVMQHEFLVKYPGDRDERITARLIEYGEVNGDTAVSRTVALPAAIAADLLLKREIKTTGLLRPVMPEIYEPVLFKLEELGIVMTEEIKLTV